MPVATVNSKLKGEKSLCASGNGVKLRLIKLIKSVKNGRVACALTM